MLMHWLLQRISHRNYAFEMNGDAVMDNGSQHRDLFKFGPRGNDGAELRLQVLGAV